jgi:hypothetical protein
MLTKTNKIKFFTKYFLFLLSQLLILEFAQIPKASAGPYDFIQGRCSGNRETVRLYDHNNGGGNHLEVCSGQVNLHKMPDGYNDIISSISGYRPVTLWEDSYERGRCIIVNPRDKILNLVDYGFDNKVSSAAYGSYRQYGCIDYTQQTEVSNPNQCPSITGSFFRPGDNMIIFWEQEGCNIRSNAPSPGFDHAIKAQWAGNYFSYTVTRRNTQNGCTTQMYGRLFKINNSLIRTEIYGSDGRCDLPTGFTEVSMWQRR